MSDNLANQEKSAKKSKKVETGKVPAAKSTSSQETIKPVERNTETCDEERRKEQDRHNSGTSSTTSQPVYPRPWSNNQRYTKYRGSSESRRGHSQNYGNRDLILSSSSLDSGNLARHTSTQSLNSNASKKIEEEPVEVAASTASSDAANDIRRIAVNAPDSEEGKVTYIAAGTAPAARIGTLRQPANAAAFSAYAGPAPRWDNQAERGARGGFPPVPSSFKPNRSMDEAPRYYDKREEGSAMRRPPPDSSRLIRRGGGIKRCSERTSIGEMDMERDTSAIFFQQQNDENCRNSLVSINALSQMQQQLAESQGMKGQSLPRLYGDWRRRGEERDAGGRARGRRPSEGEPSLNVVLPNAVGEKKEPSLYPAATSKVCGVEERERKREESTSHYDHSREVSQPSTPTEADLIFTSSSSTPIGCGVAERVGSMEAGNEMDGPTHGSTPISVKAFHNGIPVPPIHTEMRDIPSLSSNPSPSISHRRPPLENPLIPSGGGHLTSIPSPSLTTTVSTSSHPTVSSVLPPSMVAHPQRSQESLYRTSSARHHYHHPPPPLPSSHLSAVSSSSNPMLHSPQRNPPFVHHPPTGGESL